MLCVERNVGAASYPNGTLGKELADASDRQKRRRTISDKGILAFGGQNRLGRIVLEPNICGRYGSLRTRGTKHASITGSQPFLAEPSATGIKDTTGKLLGKP